MSLRLDATQQTLLIPLYGRAAGSRRRWPLLRDPKAQEILAAIDYDIDRLRTMGQGLRGAVLRTGIYDIWAADFLDRHPDGTVVEVGTGLNTRYERLDNGRVRWFDLDLPEVIDLRRRFFTDTDRRTMIAASVLDPEWIDVVKAAPGPYLFLAEAVLLYLSPAQVAETLTMIAGAFPGARLVLDTGTRKMADGKDHTRHRDPAEPVPVLHRAADLPGRSEAGVATQVVTRLEAAAALRPRARGRRSPGPGGRWLRVRPASVRRGRRRRLWTRLRSCQERCS